MRSFISPHGVLRCSAWIPMHSVSRFSYPQLHGLLTPLPWQKPLTLGYRSSTLASTSTIHSPPQAPSQWFRSEFKGSIPRTRTLLAITDPRHPPESTCANPSASPTSWIVSIQTGPRSRAFTEPRSRVNLQWKLAAVPAVEDPSSLETKQSRISHCEIAPTCFL